MWMVENHFCIGFIKPFCQSLQSNQKFSQSVSWKGLSITNSVSFIQWTCHNVLIINDQTIEGQKASFFLYQKKDYKMRCPRWLNVNTWCVRGSTSMTSSPSTRLLRKGIMGFSWWGKYSPLISLYVLCRSIFGFELVKRSGRKNPQVNKQVNKTHDIRHLLVCL